MDFSPPGSSVHGILQARTLEWVAISFSSAWKWKVKVKSLSHVRLFATPWTAASQAPLSLRFPRQKYWSGLLLPSPLFDPWNPMDFSPPGPSVQGILQARILEWAVTPSPRALLPDPETEVVSPALAHVFFTTSATWEACLFKAAQS